jgi:hypothetical protein
VGREIDAGKTHHHCAVINDESERPYSRRIANDEAELTQMIIAVTALGEIEARACRCREPRHRP